MNSSLRTLDMVESFEEDIFAGNDAFIAVPFPYIEAARRRFPRHIRVGAQDCSRFKEGAYTGEVSAVMVKEMGAEYVIVGHSERRRWFSETSETVGHKIGNACDEGLNVVVCVGEDVEDRRSGRHLEVIMSQIQSLEKEISQKHSIDIAYEPVWAIGTGMLPTESQVEEVFSSVWRWAEGIGFGGRIIYGGSVTVSNYMSILDIDGVGGFLLGGSSLNTDFCTISRGMGERKQMME